MTAREEKKHTVRLPYLLPKKQFELSTRTSERGLSCLLCGVAGILVYSDTEMTFRTARGRVAIKGEALRCRTYISGNAEVSGRVACICFEEG